MDDLVGWLVRLSSLLCVIDFVLLLTHIYFQRNTAVFFSPAIR
jgi:hypothetical protein